MNHKSSVQFLSCLVASGGHLRPRSSNSYSLLQAMLAASSCSIQEGLQTIEIDATFSSGGLCTKSLDPGFGYRLQWRKGWNFHVIRNSNETNYINKTFIASLFCPRLSYANILPIYYPWSSQNVQQCHTSHTLPPHIAFALVWKLAQVFLQHECGNIFGNLLFASTQLDKKKRGIAHHESWFRLCYARSIGKGGVLGYYYTPSYCAVLTIMLCTLKFLKRSKSWGQFKYLENGGMSYLSIS